MTGTTGPVWVSVPSAGTVTRHPPSQEPLAERVRRPRLLPPMVVRSPAGGVVRRRGHIFPRQGTTVPRSCMSHLAGVTNSNDHKGET